MSQKNIRCHHCGKELLVSSRAFSICCSGCNRRVNVEDRTITDHHATKQIETSGSIVVAPRGELHAQLRVKDLQVQGRLLGNVTADEKVTLNAQGQIVGDITAARLEVDCGARLKGFCRIEPQEP